VNNLKVQNVSESTREKKLQLISISLNMNCQYLSHEVPPPPNLDEFLYDLGNPSMGWESGPVQLQKGCNSSSPGDPKLLGFFVFPIENGNDTVDGSEIRLTN